MTTATRATLVLLNLCALLMAGALFDVTPIGPANAPPGTSVDLPPAVDAPDPALVDAAHASTAVAAAPTPTRAPAPTDKPPVSQVLPVAIAPSPVVPPASLAGGTSLPIPGGTRVVWGGCASDGECHWYNFYWAPTREAVMQRGEGPLKVQHELCHAHQHWTVNRGAPLSSTDYDLHSWYLTPEGQSFVRAVARLPWPWSNSRRNAIEDFAWTCAYWYLDTAYLQRVSPERHAWAAANLP